MERSLSCLYARTDLSRLCEKMLKSLILDSLAAEIIEGFDVAGRDKLVLQQLAGCYTLSTVKLKHPL